MFELLQLLAAITEGEESHPWWSEWLVPSGLERLLQAGGLIVLAWLFASNRIITAGQHNARVKDLTDHHARELSANDNAHTLLLGAKDEAYSEMRESRDYYRGASTQQKERADRATDQLAESVEIARTAAYALQALGQVATEGGEPK